LNSQKERTMSELVLRAMSDAEVEKLHEKTLELFEKVGVYIGHEETLRRLKQAGARIDEASGRVRFPAALVRELLSLAPPVARETGLNGRLLEAGWRNRYYLSLILDPFIIDYRDGVRRPVLEDVRRHTIVGESLDRINSMMRMQFPVSDIPEPDCYYKTMEVFLCHTTKHTATYPTSEENCRDWMDVMAVIADAAGLDVNSTPLMTVAMAVTSPLQLHGPNVEIMKMAMERCYPIVSTVCPMAGTTAPYSIAGTSLIANAEALLAVLITQCYKPGHPVFYSVGPSVTEMKSGHDMYYRAEKMLFKLAGVQMGKYYNLPISGEAGGTLTHRPDVQNGAESTMYLLAAFSGQNIIGGLGSMHNANGMSAEQIIMQCGLADMVEYVSRGIDTSDHKLALESIAEAGPGGNFLTDSLTIEQLRGNEFFKSPFVDLTGGYKPQAPDMYEIAHQAAEQMVSQYRPTVPEKVQDAIRKHFERKYTAKQAWKSSDSERRSPAA
jgi:trimethylamine---corrinoid protein Co-methyltransferase